VDIEIYLEGERTRYVIKPNGEIWNAFYNKKMSLSVASNGTVLCYLSHRGKRYAKSAEKLLREYGRI
jgi:hypothetical protein